MKNQLTKGALTALTALACLAHVQAQNVGQWDFESGDLSATAGSTLGPLTYIDGPNGTTSNLTVFGTTAALGVPNINGTVANIMGFPGNSTTPIGYFMPTPPANGGGSLVNDYTVIFDVLYTNSGVFRPLLQMDDGQLDNILALLAIDRNNAITVTNTQGAALPGGSFGQIQPGTWYRIGFVVDTDNGQISVYTNGEPVGLLDIGLNQVDSPYALFAGDLPLFSSNQTNSPGYANSVQIRDVVLNPGEMEAIGAPSAAGIPITLPPAHSYIASRFPGFGETGISPEPTVQIDLNQGNSTVTPGSISLTFDGAVVAAVIAAGTNNDFTIQFAETNIFDPLSIHTLSLSYTDSISGAIVKTWQFTVADYQNVTLPAPIYFENFDELTVVNDTNFPPVTGFSVPNGLGATVNVDPTAPANSPLPPGWTVTNYTAIQHNKWDLTDPQSDYYLNWVVVPVSLLDTNSSFNDQGDSATSPGLGTVTGTSRPVSPPVVLNGVLLTNLFSNNVIYAESDNRQNSGGQVNILFTSDYNLTGYSNVYVAFHSMYEQNQDNLGSVEYSIDQGHTWLPALYLLDDGTTDGDGSDVVTTNGQIDVTATFGTARNDQAFNLAYSNFIGAAVSTNLIPFIQGRRNDDQLASKRIEIIRLAQADNQSHVRFRFCQAGTSSWFFGFDDFGLYKIVTPVISVQPLSQTVNANTPVTFTVLASGATSYQWKFNGNSIPNATNASYTIPSVTAGNAGNYTVVASNDSGPATSNPATLTVNTTPVITTQPAGEIVDLNGAVTFTTAATGAYPLTYTWYFNGASVQSSTSPALTIGDAVAGSVGNYQVVVTSTGYGAVTSAVAALNVWSGSITSNLVVHLPFDGNLNDTSGRGNNATYMFNGASSSPTPRFVPGFIGAQAFEYTTTSDYLTQEYASLGYPTDLQFDGLQDFSVSFWARYTNQSDDLPFIANKDWDSSSNPGWGIFSQTGGNYRINVTGPNQGSDKFSETDTPATMKDGNWHSVVVSIQRPPFGEQAFVYGYLDGRLVTKHPLFVVGTIDTENLPFTDHQPVTSVQTSFEVNIGQDGTGVYADNHSAFNINAAIDDLGIWRRAVTANEALAIYRAGLAGLDLSQALSSTLFITVSGGNVHLTWMGETGVQLEQTATLHPANWTAVSGTSGANSATVPVGGTAAFFRLHKVQ